MQRVRRAWGLGAALVVFGTAFVPAGCQIEEGTPGPGAGGAAPAPTGTAGGGTGAPRLPASFELRARWGDAGVQQTDAQEGASTRRIFTRQGVGQSITFAPDDAARAMATGAVELGLFNLPLYTFTRPAPGACQPRIDVNITGGALTYRLSADEPATQSACASFMGETSRGAEVVYDGVPVGVSSGAVEAPAFVQIKVVFSP
ncbi:MAG TPA: hypothetical protein VFS43_08675 [Polyangiaceae bacterium]|nr:hypothetical protein [Polyangiaceae bacterium]